MENKIDSILPAALLAAISSVSLVVLLTVVGELYAPLKNHLTATLYHHWVGKGVWSVVLFAVVMWGAYRFFKNKTAPTKTLLGILNASLLIGSAVLFFFFVYLYTAHH